MKSADRQVGTYQHKQTYAAKTTKKPEEVYLIMVTAVVSIGKYKL